MWKSYKPASQHRFGTSLFLNNKSTFASGKPRQFIQTLNFEVILPTHLFLIVAFEFSLSAKSLLLVFKLDYTLPNVSLFFFNKFIPCRAREKPSKKEILHFSC